MNIEQTAPRKPNFLLVVVLAGLTIILLFVLAYVFLDYDGKHLTFRHHREHPTSRLIDPAVRAGKQTSALSQA